VNEYSSALGQLRTASQTFGSNATLLSTRKDFTETLVNTLKEGSDKLTLADLNEEGANLLALQTRQQLGINALSLASQSEQAVLSLFR
jgi:flagellin